jgi:hypothetical protein
MPLISLKPKLLIFLQSVDIKDIMLHVGYGRAVVIAPIVKQGTFEC